MYYKRLQCDIEKIWENGDKYIPPDSYYIIELLPSKPIDMPTLTKLAEELLIKKDNLPLVCYIPSTSPRLYFLFPPNPKHYHNGSYQLITSEYASLTCNFFGMK